MEGGINFWNAFTFSEVGQLLAINDILRKITFFFKQIFMRVFKYKGCGMQRLLSQLALEGLITDNI